MTPAERLYLGSHERHIVEYYERARHARKLEDCRRAYERRDGRVIL